MVSSAAYGVNFKLDIPRLTTLSRPRDLPWYAIQIRSKLAGIASATLRAKGYEDFLPLYRSRRRWSDRIKELDLPLFPGYLFCRFDASDCLPILTTPGVVAIIGTGKTPVPVDDHEIKTVRTILHSGLVARSCPFLRVGSKVYLEAGPLAGVEGIVTNTDKVYRLIVSVSLLQRSIAVEVDRAWARPIDDGNGGLPGTVLPQAFPDAAR